MRIISVTWLKDGLDERVNEMLTTVYVIFVLTSKHHLEDLFGSMGGALIAIVFDIVLMKFAKEILF